MKIEIVGTCWSGKQGLGSKDFYFNVEQAFTSSTIAKPADGNLAAALAPPSFQRSMTFCFYFNVEQAFVP
jgi:hypothetical protein